MRCRIWAFLAILGLVSLVLLVSVAAGDGPSTIILSSLRAATAEKVTSKDCAGLDPNSSITSVPVPFSSTGRKIPGLLLPLEAAPRCPRVFVYQLQRPFTDLGSQAFPSELTDYVVFGRRVKTKDKGVTWYETRQWSNSLAFLWRLNRSKCSTKDPAKADLFYVPLLPVPKDIVEWNNSCNELTGRWQELQAMLPHLTNETAFKHFMVVPTAYWVLTNCRGFWAEPEGLFKDFARVGNNVGFPPKLLAENPILESQGGWIPPHYLNVTAFPNYHVSPYTSIIHPSYEDALPFPWTQRFERTVLASFAGTNFHGDMPVREKLEKLCVKHSNHSSVLQCHKWSRRAVDVKLSSVFCLNPMGDSIGRKSLYDDYGCGCIPVLFGSAQAFQHPEHWQGWAHAAYVAVDRLAFIRGEVDLIALLRKLNGSGAVQEIQENVARYAGRFQYFMEDMPPMEDAVSVMLRHLWVDADRRKRAAAGFGNHGC